MLLQESTFYDYYRYTYSRNICKNKECYCKCMSINKNYFNRLINNFLMYDLVEKTILEQETEIKTIYKFKNILSNFVLLTKSEINKLLFCSSNEIKVFLVIKYLLANTKEKDIELRYIAKKIGLSETNSKTIKELVERLKVKNLINYYFYIDTSEEIRKKRYVFINLEFNN